MAWLIAAGFHEMCHWLAVKICGGDAYRIVVGISGAKMECGPMSNPRRLFCVLSGPIGGMIPVLFSKWIPCTALCCWLLSVYNLLPLAHLDGGRILEILLRTKATVVQNVFLIGVSVSAIYVTFVWGFGVLPMGIVAFLWLKNRNTPCKPGVSKVQ